MTKLRLILFVGLLVFIAMPGWAGQYTIFGPQQYVRGTGQPVSETMNFASPVSGTGFSLSVQTETARETTGFPVVPCL